MDCRKLKKPEHRRADVWDQHLHWMDVMGKQVDQNYRQHQQRVEQDANRSKALSAIHDSVLQAAQCAQSLFSTPKH